MLTPHPTPRATPTVHSRAHSPPRGDAMLALRAPLVERVPSRVPFRARSRLVVRRVSASGASGASDGSAPRRPSIRAPPPRTPPPASPLALLLRSRLHLPRPRQRSQTRGLDRLRHLPRRLARREPRLRGHRRARLAPRRPHPPRPGRRRRARRRHARLASVPPVADFDHDPVLTDARCVDVLARSDNLRWLGYLSSTGVYGDKLGAWVDEDEPAEPLSPKSVARLDAERAWFELAARHTLPLKIFRLGGIYGPEEYTGRVAAAAARRGGRVAAGPEPARRENLEDTRVDATWQISSPRSARA